MTELLDEFVVQPPPVENRAAVGVIDWLPFALSPYFRAAGPPGSALAGIYDVYREATRTVPVSLAIQSLIQPMPTATQADETAALERMYQWREFFAGIDTGTPALPQSPALPASTETPEVVQLPTVTVSPPAVQTKPRTESPPVPAAPTLISFSPLPLDTPLPGDEVFPDIPAAPPGKTAAPAVPGAVPIGLPLGVITLPRDIPWWELAPATAAPSPQMPRPATPIPFLPEIPNVTVTPGIGTVPSVGIQPGLDTRTGSPGGSVRTAVPDTQIINIGVDLATPGVIAAPSTVRPVELSPALELGTGAFPAFFEPLPFASPFAGTRTAAPPRVGTPDRADNCDCAPKKKKKPRPDRTKCYRGTYVERRKGLSKTRLEEVPCEAAPKKPKAKRAPKLKPGQFPGLSLTGGQMLDLGAQAMSEFAPIILDWLEHRKPKPETKPKKPSKAKKPRRNRRPKTKVGRLPGTPYTTPFPIGD